MWVIKLIREEAYVGFFPKKQIIGRSEKYMTGDARFYEIEPTLENYWRAIYLEFMDEVTLIMLS